jgi:hypothetical protein
MSQESTMNRSPDAQTCERGNDLISFLYGEIDEGAARGFEQDFERHLLNCSQCEAKLGAFKQIRSSVIAWRQESLGGATANLVSLSPAVDTVSSLRQPSAIAAIRQFFQLSPLWLKGAVAFAAVVFCLVSVIALAPLFEKPAPVVAGDMKKYTDKELEAKIADALKSQLRNPEAQPTPLSAGVAVNNEQQNTNRKRMTRPSSVSAATNPIRRGPLTKSEREQLAADLRLIPQDEGDLDLLGDGSN